MCVCVYVCVSHNAYSKQRSVTGLRYGQQSHKGTEPLYFTYRNIRQRWCNLSCAMFEFILQYSTAWRNIQWYPNSTTLMHTRSLVYSHALGCARLSASVGAVHGCCILLWLIAKSPTDNTIDNTPPPTPEHVTTLLSSLAVLLTWMLVLNALHWS